MSPTELEIRAATRDDARDLARLIDMAGEGIPRWLWSRSAAPGEDPIEVGERRAARREGGFSYRNAHVAEAAGQIAGMLLGYRLPDPYPAENLTQLPDVVRPMIELEMCVPGSWYLNAISVYESFRGRGYGKRLMQLADELARESGAPKLSLIVAEENTGAVHLYEQSGYRVQDRRPIVAIAGMHHRGDWLLMVKSSLADSPECVDESFTA